MTVSGIASRRSTAAERSTQLQRNIMEIILDRRLRPGDAMPTEVELVEELGVGRNTVREALKVLQSMGIVEVRHGYGMFVASKSLDTMTMGLEFHARMSLSGSGNEALEVVAVRQALEAGLIGAAMKAMTEEDIQRLEECVVGMETDAALGRMNPEKDHAFHHLLFAPLGNELLGSLLESFWSVYGKIRDRIHHAGPEAIENARVHRRILDSIVAGDALLASDLMSRHFDGFRAVLLEAVASGSGVD